MADETIEQRQAAVPQAIAPGTKLATMVAGVTGGADFDAIDGDKLPVAYEPEHYTRTDAPTEVDDVARLTAHLAGIDAKFGTITTDDCCTALGAYEPENYSVGEQTPAAQLAGIDAALGAKIGGEADGVVVADGALQLSGTDLQVDDGDGETPTVTYAIDAGTGQVTQAGELTIANPGTAVGPALEIDRGEGGPLGVYSPGENQIGLVANEKPVILDGGEASVLRPATDLALALGTSAVRWGTSYISTLVAPLIAAAADPVNQAVSLVLSALTAARTITVPDHDYTLNTLRESGATVLTMGAVADGQMLVRSGTTIAGAAVGGQPLGEAVITGTTHTHGEGNLFRVNRCTHESGCTVTLDAGTAGDWAVYVTTDATLTIAAGTATRVVGLETASSAERPITVSYLTTTTYMLTGGDGG